VSHALPFDRAQSERRRPCDAQLSVGSILYTKRQCCVAHSCQLDLYCRLKRRCWYVQKHGLTGVCISQIDTVWETAVLVCTETRSGDRSVY
jgi:hypothetical protein